MASLQIKCSTVTAYWIYLELHLDDVDTIKAPFGVVEYFSFHKEK